MEVLCRGPAGTPRILFDVLPATIPEVDVDRSDIAVGDGFAGTRHHIRGVSMAGQSSGRRARTRRPRAFVTRLLDRLDHVGFRATDLDAIARGWQIRGSDRFQRTYRDPRWDSISACSTCDATGLLGAETCSDCAGAGTVRSAPVEPTRVEKARPS
jgi:hypothetical protein